MTRSKILVLPLLLLFVVAISCKRKLDPTRVRSTAPLILVSIDTLRADHLPAYGYDSVETPAIDQFAKESVLFERCYSHCPQTLPSHTCILTGRLPFEHGVRDNIGFFLKQDQTTIASILKGHGFDTGGFVSSFVLRPETRIGMGFDRYDAEMKREKAEVSFGELQRKGERTIEAATAWLDSLGARQNSSRRFFLFLHLYEPHTPYQPPEPYASQYATAPYDGEIAYVDQLLGTFFQNLKEKKLYDQALIVLTSDHGEGLGDHGEREHGVFVYNETIHVPLFIKFPGSAEGGTRVGEPVQHIDLLPTVLDFYGIQGSGTYQGASLLGLSKPHERRVVYSESLYPLYHFGWSEIYSLTDYRYKFIKCPREELYDLSKDPGENQNRAASLEPTAAEYRYQIDQALANRTVESPGEISPEEMEKLQALGYIGVASTQARAGGQKPDAKDQIHLLEDFRRGLQLHRKGEEAGAAAVFKAIINENPDMVDVLEQLGRSLAQLGQSQEAVPILRRVEELRSDNALTLLGVARIYWKLGLVAEAVKCLDHAVEVNSSLARGFELKGQILFSAGDLTGAMVAFDRALELDDTLPMPYYAKGLAAFQQGKLDDALLLMRRAEAELAKREKNLFLPALHYYIAMILVRRGDASGAEQEYGLELKRMPSNAAARVQLAQLLLRQGRRQEAVSLFDDPQVTTPEAARVVAKFLAAIGEDAKAEELSSRFKVQSSKSPS